MGARLMQRRWGSSKHPARCSDLVRGGVMRARIAWDVERSGGWSSAATTADSGPHSVAIGRVATEIGTASRQWPARLAGDEINVDRMRSCRVVEIALEVIDRLMQARRTKLHPMHIAPNWRALRPFRHSRSSGGLATGLPRISPAGGFVDSLPGNSARSGEKSGP